jgi:hypothetical protein
MTTSFRSALIAMLVGSAGAGCGGGLMEAELELPEICILRQGQHFEALPIPLPVSWVREVELDLGSPLRRIAGEPVAAEARVVSLRVSPASGIDSMEFVESGRFDLEPPSGEGEPFAAVTWEADDGSSDVQRPYIQTSGEWFDLLPFLSTERMRGTVLVSGTPPQVEWTADVEACLSLRSRHRR